MEITFTCPHCGEGTLIGEEFVGRSGECRACGKLVFVPKPEVSSRDAQVGSVSFTWANLRKALVSLAVVCFGLCALVLAFSWVLIALVNHGKFEGRRRISENNLRQIGIAMQNYHTEHGCLPRAHWKSATGERTLSWRVALLPYLEAKDYFDLIDVSKPWDSLENKRAINGRIPTFMMPIEDDSPMTDTSYVVITGPGTLFEEGKSVTFAECTDGLQNTILAVEVSHSHIHWTEPRDFDIRTMRLQINGAPSIGISSPWPGGANVLFADGSVRFLRNELLESDLKAMITRGGGESISFDNAR